MIIREAKKSDISEIHNLGKDVREFSTTDEVVTFWPKYILQNCIESRTDFLIVAEENNKIIGFTIVNYNPIFKKAVIENLYVHSNYRGRRIGYKLLNSAIERLKKTGCEYVCALTETTNEKVIKLLLEIDFNKGKNYFWLDKVLNKKFSK